MLKLQACVAFLYVRDFNMPMNLHLEFSLTSFWILSQNPPFRYQNLYILQAFLENAIIFVYNLGTSSHML